MIPTNDALTQLVPSAIRRYTRLAADTPDCIPLTLGEPGFDTPAPIREAAWQALQEGQTHYAPNQGLLSLRTAIAEHETARGYACTAQDILITAGATGALYTALLGILNPGDEVIVPTPAFPLYASIAAVARAKVVPLPLAQTGFQITPEALSRVMTCRTKAIVLNSPNNPTGVVLSRESLEAVKAAVLGKDIYLVCDNVYQALCPETCPDLTTDPELYSQVLLCQSFSKPYAMTGWRVGYLAAPQPVLERLLLLHAAQVASIPTFLQSACVTALAQDIRPMAQVYDRRRAYVCRRLQEMGIPFPQPGGAFYVFAQISSFGMDADTFCTRLIREGKVATVPGTCFGTDGYLRLSCACSDDTLREGLDRIERFISTL